jgi:hypothetical protein
MPKLRETVALIFLLACAEAVADTLPMPPPNPSGNPGIIIVASDSPEYIREWLSTPPSHGVTIKRLRVAKADQLIVASFLVHGIAANSEGKFSFSVSFYVLGPDGKPIFGVPDYAKGNGVIPQIPAYIMADPALDIILENSDPPGVYTIVAQVVDNINGKKADAFYKIRFDKNAL